VPRVLRIGVIAKGFWAGQFGQWWTKKLINWQRKIGRHINTQLKIVYRQLARIVRRIDWQLKNVGRHITHKWGTTVDGHVKVLGGT